MDYSLNVCTPVSFDDGDIFEYLDSITLPVEPTDEEGLDDEAVEITMDFIKVNLVSEVDEEPTKNTSAFKDLVLHMENYIYLKRHAPHHLYESLKKMYK